MWVDAPTVWIPDKAWADIESVVDIDSLEGKPCTMAIDLAAVNDYVATCKMFTEGGRYQFLWHFFIPEEKYKARYEVQREHSNISEWVRKGYVTVTPGNTIDDSFVLASIYEDLSRYDVKAIAYDPWNSKTVASDLTERGANMQPFTQTIGNFAYPTREFERFVGLGLIDHYANPVARWMLSNVVIREDVNGNRRPDKAKSTEKIDGIVAALMALGQHLSDVEDNTSVYEHRGLLGYRDGDDAANTDNTYTNYNNYDYDD
jgi:phage terminase large subunit-like protein